MITGINKWSNAQEILNPEASGMSSCQRGGGEKERKERKKEKKERKKETSERKKEKN